MPTLNNQEIDAYYLADPVHPRAAGVLWPSLLERRIDKLFEIALRPDAKVRADLLRPGGALGNYAVKVQLAYLLGWFGEDFYRDLLLVAKIRNRFAHCIEAKTFSDERIAAWLKNMNIYKKLPGMLERARRRVTNKEPLSMARQLILEGNLDDLQAGFRFCIDIMMHEADRCAEAMSKNLSKLPANWLVSDDASPKTPTL
jgi:hypothetical protein